MAFYKTVSIKEVLGRIYRNIKPVDSSWENDIYEWLWEGMEKTRVRTSLQPTSQVMTIKDYQTNEPLPCGLMVLDAVLYKGNRLRQSNTVLDVPKIKDQFESQLVTLPMNSEHIRSLNLSNCATAAAYEALRQIDFT